MKTKSHKSEDELIHWMYATDELQKHRNAETA